MATPYELQVAIDAAAPTLNDLLRDAPAPRLLARDSPVATVAGVPADAPTILATSGGAWPDPRTGVRIAPLIHHGFELAGVDGRRPRLCYVPTAGGDDARWISWFHDAGRVAGVEVTHLSLFPMPNTADPAGMLGEADWCGSEVGTSPTSSPSGRFTASTSCSATCGVEASCSVVSRLVRCAGTTTTPRTSAGVPYGIANRG